MGRGRPKISCDYDLFGPCRRHAAVRFTVERRDGSRVVSQYCDEHEPVMLSQPIPKGWKIKQREMMS